MSTSLKPRRISAVLLLALWLAMLPFDATAQHGGLSWSLQGPAADVVACDSGFLALVEGTLWMCRADEPSPALVFAPDAGVWIDKLFAGDADGVLALFATREAYEVLRVDVDEATLSPVWRISRQDAPTGYMRRAVWQEGRIVLEYQTGVPWISDLLVFDTATGESASIYGCDLFSLTPYQGGALLGVQPQCGGEYPYAIVAYDMATGNTAPILMLDAQPEALCFDAEKQRIIAFQSPNAVLLSTTGERLGQVYFPVAYSGEGGRRCAPGANRLLALSDGARLLTADMEAGQDIEAVQITRYNEDGAETKRFRLSHPEIPVQSVNLGFQLTPAMIGQRIRSNDTQTDLFMMRTFAAGYRELLENGFCADLSDQETIVSDVARMPSGLSSALMADGRLLGVPVEITFDGWTALTCAYETLDDVGIALEEIPTNLSDLLDRLAEWHEDGVLDGIRLFASNDQAFAITWFVLNNYACYAASQSRALDYDTPLFRSLMEKCDRLCALLSQQPAPGDTAPFLFAKSEPDMLLSSDWDDGQSAFLPITPQAGMRPCYPAFLTVATLNPLSQNKEAALVYLRSLLGALPAKTRLCFWPGQMGTNERDSYQERRQMAVDDIERLEGLLGGGTLDIVGRNEIQLQLADAMEWLEELDVRQRWEVSPDAVNAYLSIADNVFVPDSVVAEMLDEAMIDTVRQYAAGQMACATLVESIVRKARMIEMEQDSPR